MIVYLYLVDVSHIDPSEQELRHAYVKKELGFLRGQFSLVDDVEIVAVPSNQTSTLITLENQ